MDPDCSNLTMNKQNDMQSTTFRAVEKPALLGGLSMFVILLLVACVPREGGDRFYVIVKPNETQQFLSSVTLIAKDLGLNANVGHAAKDNGEQLHVLEATNRRVRLWLQNVLLTGNEDPSACGEHNGTHSDPAQFVIYTRPTWLALDSKVATVVAADVRARLKSLGYAVSKDQALCGLAGLSSKSMAN